MKQLIEIHNDLFDIADRLKSVNAHYKLYFNVASEKYEVHDENQRGSTLAFVVPYDELDARTVNFALFTRVQNAKNLFEEIEKANAVAEKQAAAQAVEQVFNRWESVV